MQWCVSVCGRVSVWECVNGFIMSIYPSEHVRLVGSACGASCVGAVGLTVQRCTPTQALFLCASSVMVGIVFGLSLSSLFGFLLWVVFVDCKSVCFVLDPGASYVCAVLILGHATGGSLCRGNAYLRHPILTLLPGPTNADVTGIATGAAIASALWYVSNKYLRTASPHAVMESVSECGCVCYRICACYFVCVCRCVYVLQNKVCV